MIRGVAKKHTPGGPRRQLVGSSGGEVGITRTPEDTKVVVTRWSAEQGVVRGGSRTSSGGKVVEQLGSSVEALGPEAAREGGMEKKGVHDIVRCVNHPLSLAVLKR